MNPGIIQTLRQKGKTEAPEIKRLRKPQEPSQKDWEEHMILHWPFRSWCPHCVNGRATGEWHRSLAGQEIDEIPTICIDYMYMISEEDEERSEIGKGECPYW